MNKSTSSDSTVVFNVIRQALSEAHQTYRGLLLRNCEKSIRTIESIIAHFSLMGDTEFFDIDQFKWVSILESNWMSIRQEIDLILDNINQIPNFQDISVDQYDITQDDRWKTYFLYAYGLKAEKNCQRCPQTTKLIEQIPGMKTAFFSILLPHKHIPEHRGPYKGVLRYHLGLKIPKSADKCKIRVGQEIRIWQAGKSLIFDDTFPHEAWNDTDEIRVVLFLDFIRPLPFPLSIFNKILINLIALSPYVQDGKRRFEQWENRF
jgi:beta-hydroxylase